MEIKWDKRTIIVCSVIGSLGVLSAILGFSAEGTKLTPYTILVYGDACIYPQNPALGLGVSAVIFLLAAQIIFSVVGSCCGCCRSRSFPTETKRIIGIVCAVVSWILAVIAWVLLIQGAAWNANVVRMTAPDCYYLKDGVFAGAGVLTLVATALGIVSLFMMRQPVEAVTPAAAGTPNSPGEQSPSVEVAQLNKPQHRPKPQNPQSPPAAAQANGTPAQNQQFPPHGHPSATAPPVVACASPEPSGQPPPFGVAMDQPQVPLPQVYTPSIPNDMPQNPIGPAPASLSTVVRNEVTKEAIQLVSNMLQRTFFSDNTATPSTLPGDGDIILSMLTDSTGGDVQATN